MLYIDSGTKQDLRIWNFYDFIKDRLLSRSYGDGTSVKSLRTTGETLEQMTCVLQRVALPLPHGGFCLTKQFLFILEIKTSLGV